MKRNFRDKRGRRHMTNAQLLVEQEKTTLKLYALMADRDSFVKRVMPNSAHFAEAGIRNLREILRQINWFLVAGGGYEEGIEANKLRLGWSTPFGVAAS